MSSSSTATLAATIVKVGSASEFDVLAEKYTSVVVMFTAKWCEKCDQMYADFVQLADRHRLLRFALVDIDQVPSIADEFNVESVPAVLLMHDGKATVLSKSKRLSSVVKHVEELDRMTVDYDKHNSGSVGGRASPSRKPHAAPSPRRHRAPASSGSSDSSSSDDDHHHHHKGGSSGYSGKSSSSSSSSSHHHKASGGGGGGSASGSSGKGQHRSSSDGSSHHARRHYKPLASSSSDSDHHRRSSSSDSDDSSTGASR